LRWASSPPHFLPANPPIFSVGAVGLEPTLYGF
jgi:hypothetical protein